MSGKVIDRLTAEVKRARLARRLGRVTKISSGRVFVGGLNDIAAIGDQVSIGTGADTIPGEVVELDDASAIVLPEKGIDGLSVGQPVAHDGPFTLAPDDSWLGRLIDPSGAPLDGRPIMNGPESRALCPPVLNPAARRPLGTRLETGLSVFNTLLPLVRGQRIGLFAGSGVGKSTLLGRLATGIDVDVVVVALVGERGREVREFIDKILGKGGMTRAVVVAATADRSPLLRRRCAEAAMCVAEHFRDAGKQVLLLADSITRFAEAHREIALASGESSAMRGFPPSTAQRIMALAERAGPGTDQTADITAILTVLVAGSDMEEPVADTLRGVLDGHVVLDREIAERGRFPPIDVTRSVSRALPDAATDDENELIGAARGILGTYERSEMMVRAGLYAAGSDPAIDRALDVWPRLDRFFAKRSDAGIPASFADLAEVLQAPDTGSDAQDDDNGAQGIPADPNKISAG